MLQLSLWTTVRTVFTLLALCGKGIADLMLTVLERLCLSFYSACVADIAI